MNNKALKVFLLSAFALSITFQMVRGVIAQPGADKRATFVYGGGVDGQRYSPLTQINRSNVLQLESVWTFDGGDGAGDSQTQPVIVDGVLYGVSAKHKVFAVDMASGRELWRFDSGVVGRGPNRGVSVWSDSKGKRVFAAVQSFVYALDAATGTPIPSFGSAGRIDLREGLGRDPARASVVLTTPGVVFKDLLIVSGRFPESLPSSPGDIRAFDVRTGKARWAFHTVPRPGEPGYETWPKDAWTYTGSANNWSGMAVDEERGIVFVPTGSAADDFYGANRAGDNLFSDTLLALDAATGKRLWHFQAVKHDIWDRDFPSPPTLVTVRHNGTRVDAVAQATKSGHVYLFERVSGTPLFPIEYKKYPASTVPGEVAADTQPLPTKPAPFSRQALTEELLTNRTPESRTWALEQLRGMNSAGQFVPIGLSKETIIFPGFDGGAEWGGSAFDPETGLLYVNANEMAWRMKLAENQAGNSGRQLYNTNCATCHGDDLGGSPPQMPSLKGIGSKFTAETLTTIIRQGAGRMPAFANLSQADLTALIQFVLSGEDKELAATPVANRQRYRFTGYTRFLDPDGYPAIATPWGTLNAINLNTGEYAWKIPFGEYPELAAQGMKDTGSENYGGPLVTAGGVLFIAATNFDRKFRAFDKLTGTLLWETTLPFAGNATPASVEVGGRQFVIVHATGGKARKDEPKGDAYIAFALKR